MKIPTNWTFENLDIAKSFDTHVREQLPWYELATNAVSHISRHYIPVGGLVYDIGASTGNIGLSISSIISDRKAKIISIESSKEMCKQYHGIQKENLINEDAIDFKYDKFDLAICFLSLMFFPVKKRGLFIEKLKTLINPGGALIIFDKRESEDGYIATILWRLTLAGKVAAGVTAEQIIAKELSLNGVQRPLNKNELGNGFIEWFRFGEFSGWLYGNKIKENNLDETQT